MIKFVFVLAAVQLLIGSVSAALAQGERSIRVLSEDRQINFPGQITLEVTVEGEQAIAQVRLKYRIAGSRAWSYSNSDFLSAKQVTVKFNNLLGKSVFLPPGTGLDYYYSIRDVAGNSLDTATETFIYTDNRFTWQEVHVGALTVRYHDLPPSQVDQITEVLNERLEALAVILELQDVQEIHGYIYNSYQEASPAFPNFSQTLTQQHVFQGFAFAKSGVFVGIGLKPRLIVHESAHLMLAQFLDPGGRTIPSWLNEGFASYMEPGSRPYSGQSVSSLGQPLTAMSVVSGTPEDIEYFYLKSESVVAYLIEEYGSRSFQIFLSGLRQGSSVDEALLSAYGFDIEGLDSNWANSDLGRTAPGPGRSNPLTPFLLFNSWFLGLLILVVMVVVLVRYVYRKLRPADDDYLEWED